MYQIGLKNSAWVLITDGNEIFTAEEDVRYYTKPCSPGCGPGKNRFSRMSLSQDQLVEYCKQNQITLRAAVGVMEKTKRIIGPSTLAGGLGALVGGPIGAALGFGIAGYISSQSDFELKNIVSKFENAKRKTQDWSEADKQIEAYETKKLLDYEELARNSWNKYYKLRSLDSIDSLEGTEFEHIVKEIYISKGYKAKLTPKTGDYGVDIVATQKDQKLAIQAKRYSQPVGVKAVQEVVSGAYYYKASKAIVITNSFFTSNAKELASTLNVELIDRPNLMNMWNKAFPQNSTIPPFDIEKYEEIKKEIIGTLWRLKKSKL
ncbi:restriction endonuclease [Polynucleobacter sp. 30F-ANTBAC]|uniref:restriction endonuclease n=1 Tax=Polynucleobacter sp. 30F-ANTBAC TaxID=2689095 RepID=UPI001C0DBC17|nr:restriction endonuclease [Polynucleobacter sp. 30F-ANTBAC]MBU3600038.1 restriction endonuclease [Polynucleobacter sp. 30F-ANTBAC]